MTDIEAKALALLNEVGRDWGNVDITESINRAHDARCEALCRAIEQHEAFKQEVSDAVEEYFGGGGTSQRIKALIIPKPDPLVEVLRIVGGDDRDYCDYDIYAQEIRASLEARGFEIREKGQ
jgi:hypothetical protein